MPRLLAVKSIGGRGGFLTSFRAGGRGSLMIMPRPFSGCQIKAEIKGFFANVSFVSIQALVSSNF